MGYSDGHHWNNPAGRSMRKDVQFIARYNDIGDKGIRLGNDIFDIDRIGEEAYENSWPQGNENRGDEGIRSRKSTDLRTRME